MQEPFGEARLVDIGGDIAYPGVDFSDNLDLTPFMPGRPVSAQEGPDRIAEALHNAVSSLQSLESSSDFSGGLDSTALGLIAAKNRPVDGFIQYTEYTAASGGDIHYARRFSELGDVTLHELHGGPDVLPFAQLPPASLTHATSYRGYAIYGREQQRLAAIAASGKQHHLHGNGGDALFDPDPRFIVGGLISERNSEQAKALARAYAKAKLKNPADVFQEAGAIGATTLADSYQRLASDLRGDEPGDMADWLPRSQSLRWLSPSVRDLLAERAEHMAGQNSSYTSPADYAIALGIRDSYKANDHLQKLAKIHGISLHVPYLDRDVVSNVLAVPASERVAAGQYRPLMLNALRPILGAKVVDSLSGRQSKTSYDTEMRVGVANDLKLGERSIILKQVAVLGRLGIIDADRVRKDLSFCNVRQNFPFSALAQLVSIGASLEQDAEARSPVQQTKRIRPESIALAERPRSSYYHLPDSYYVQRAGYTFVLYPKLIADGVNYTLAALDGPSTHILRKIAQGVSLDDIIDQQQIRHANIDPGRIRQDITTYCEQLEQRGIIIAAEHPDSNEVYIPQEKESPAYSSPIQDEKLRVRLQKYDLSTTESLAAERALVKVKQQLQKPSFDIPAIIADMRLGRDTLVPATASQALRSLEIAHVTTSAISNERIACLDISLLAIEILKQQGLTAYWSIGVHSVRPDYHAWIETETGERIASASDDSPDSYIAFFKA